MRVITSAKQRLWAELERDAGTRSVALLRIGCGLMLWTRWAGDLSFYRAHEPTRYALSLAFYVLSTSLVVGFYSRLSALLAGLFTCFMIYGPVYTSYGSHHTRTLAILTLMTALTPCGHSLSFDRWWQLRRGIARPQIAPQWGRYGACLFIGSIYFWSGVDKLGWPFMSGERMEQIHMHLYLGSDVPGSVLFPWFERLSAWFVTATWLVIPFGLMHPRTQRYFMPLGVFLHGFIYFTLPVGTFSATMWVSYFAFVDPDRFDGWLAWMLDLKPPGSTDLSA